MENIYVSGLIIVLLLTANAFFVAAEFALVKARPLRLEHMVDGGSTSARMARHIQGRIEPYLAACQLGITMASLGLGWVGEPAVAALLEPAFRTFGLSEQLLHTVAFLTGFLVFSSLHIVVGEQLPKTYAIRKPEPVSAWVAWPLHGFYLVGWPLNTLLNAATARLLSAFGVAEASHGEVLTDRELQGLIDHSREHGALAESKADMLQNLFDFDRRTVLEVMVPRAEVEFLDVAQPPDETMRVMRETRHSRLPLVDRSFDNVLGVVLVKDLFAAVLEGDAAPWTDLRRFARAPLLAPETTRIGSVFDRMRRDRAHMALVVDEYGHVVGAVTLEDLLEEIVGEIADELDERLCEFEIKVEEEGRWTAHGFASLESVSNALGGGLAPMSGVKTLSGFMMRRLGKVPEVGDHFDRAGYRFTIKQVKNRHAEWVTIRRLSEPVSDAAMDEKPGPQPGVK